MNQPSNNTAILIFSRTAEREAEEKQILPHSEQSLQVDLYNDLICRTEKVVRRTSLPYFLIDEKKQVGTTFSERLASAFKHVFKKGYENVIAIGNDCPGLTANLILSAASLFQINDVVVGPTEDGGNYLIGLSNDIFDENSFSELPWKTSQLHGYIVTKSKEYNINLAELQTLSDIDSEQDFNYLKSLFTQLFIGFKAAVKRIQLNSIQQFQSQFKETEATLLQLASRAPPTA